MLEDSEDEEEQSWEAQQLRKAGLRPSVVSSVTNAVAGLRTCEGAKRPGGVGGSYLCRMGLFAVWTSCHRERETCAWERRTGEYFGSGSDYFDCCRPFVCPARRAAASNLPRLPSPPVSAPAAAMMGGSSSATAGTRGLALPGAPTGVAMLLGELGPEDLANGLRRAFSHDAGALQGVLFLFWCCCWFTTPCDASHHR